MKNTWKDVRSEVRFWLKPVAMRVRVVADRGYLGPMFCDICLHNLQEDVEYKWDANNQPLFFCMRHGKLAIRLARI